MVDMASYLRILCLTKRTMKVSRNILILISLVSLTPMVVNYRSILLQVNSTRAIRLDSSRNSDLLIPYKNGYDFLKDKLPASYAVNLTGVKRQFAPPPFVYPLTLYGYPYLIENKRLCDIKRELTFLVLVHTATNNFIRRQAMRETWASRQILEQNDIRIAFLLGMPKDDETQRRIENEMSLYGDIVQGKFLDSYHNLTHKAAMSVRWVVENCMNTKIIVKIDDDVFIPIFQYIKKAREVWSKQIKTIHCRNHVTAVRRTGKWGVDQDHFKGWKKYPFRSCMGFVQVMTADMFPSLYEAAKETPFFWIDDIYLSGLLVERVGGVKFIYPENQLLLGQGSTLKCFEARKNESCDPFVGFAKQPGFMKRIWDRYLFLNKELAASYYRK